LENSLKTFAIRKTTDVIAFVRKVLSPFSFFRLFSPEEKIPPRIEDSAAGLRALAGNPLIPLSVYFRFPAFVAAKTRVRGGFDENGPKFFTCHQSPPRMAKGPSVSRNRAFISLMHATFGP